MASHLEFNILDHLPTGHCVLACDGTVLFWNHTLEVWTGRPAPQVEGQPLLEIFPNLQEPRIQKRLIQALEEGTPAVFSHHLAPHFFPGSRLSGTERIQSTTLDLLSPDEEGRRRMLLTVVEVTDQVQREDRNRAAKALVDEEVRQRRVDEERFRVLVELSGDAVFVVEGSGKILECNAAAGLLFLRAWDDFLGADLGGLFPPQHHPVLQRLLAGGDVDRADLACLRADGSSFPVELSARGIQAGFQRQLVIQIRDLSLQKRNEEALRKANEALENLRFTDALTGLRNRRFFDAYIRGDAEKCVRAHQDQDPRLRKEILFLLVDLDHFKRVNEAYGHAAGDAVLQQSAAIFTAATRQTDLVVRWDGETFLLVARDASRAEGPVIAERVRRGVEQQLFDLGTGEVLRLTCSVGYAVFPLIPDIPGHHAPEEVISLAATALRAAKRSGRNGWVGLETLPAMPRNVEMGELTLQIQAFLDAGTLKQSSSLPRVDWER